MGMNSLIRCRASYACARHSDHGRAAPAIRRPCHVMCRSPPPIGSPHRRESAHPGDFMPIPDTTIRDDRERPTPRARPARPAGTPCRFAHGRRPGGTFEKTGLRSRRHHQHHRPCVPDPVERYETPDPVRSDAVKARFHCVRQRTGRDPCSSPNSDRDAVLSLLVTFVSADAPGSVAGP